MPSCNPQVGDVGTIFVVTIVECNLDKSLTAVDVSTAATKQICLKSPDTTKTFNAIFAPAPYGAGDGTDGKIAYIAQAGDIDRDGVWFIAGKIILPDGTTYRTEFERFRVENPICP